MIRKLLPAFIGITVLAFSASTYSQQALTPGAPAAEKKQIVEPFNENSTIRGRVKSIDAKRKLIVIAGADGQDYHFPLTTKAAEIPKVGTQTTITIDCTWPPLRCKIDWNI